MSIWDSIGRMGSSPRSGDAGSMSSKASQKPGDAGGASSIKRPKKSTSLFGRTLEKMETFCVGLFKKTVSIAQNLIPSRKDLKDYKVSAQKTAKELPGAMKETWNNIGDFVRISSQKINRGFKDLQKYVVQHKVTQTLKGKYIAYTKIQEAKKESLQVELEEGSQLEQKLQKFEAVSARIDTRIKKVNSRISGVRDASERARLKGEIKELEAKRDQIHESMEALKAKPAFNVIRYKGLIAGAEKSIQERTQDLEVLRGIDQKIATSKPLTGDEKEVFRKALEARTINDPEYMLGDLMEQANELLEKLDNGDNQLDRKDRRIVGDLIAKTEIDIGKGKRHQTSLNERLTQWKKKRAGELTSQLDKSALQKVWRRVMKEVVDFRKALIAGFREATDNVEDQNKNTFTERIRRGSKAFRLNIKKQYIKRKSEKLPVAKEIIELEELVPELGLLKSKIVDVDIEKLKLKLIKILPTLGNINLPVKDEDYEPTLTKIINAIWTTQFIKELANVKGFKAQLSFIEKYIRENVTYKISGNNLARNSEIKKSIVDITILKHFENGNTPLEQLTERLSDHYDKLYDEPERTPVTLESDSGSVFKEKDRDELLKHLAGELFNIYKETGLITTSNEELEEVIKDKFPRVGKGLVNTLYNQTARDMKTTQAAKDEFERIQKFGEDRRDLASIDEEFRKFIAGNILKKMSVEDIRTLIQDGKGRSKTI